jgi:5-methylcytosine-specific restriction endonuclease McrA
VRVVNNLPKWKRHYLRRRAKVINFLGGICVKCGETENLEVDHIYPEQKSFSISGFLTHSWAKVEPELRKCQLLCNSCHKEKSKTDGSLEKMKRAFKRRNSQPRNSMGEFTQREERGA